MLIAGALLLIPACQRELSPEEPEVLETGEGVDSTQVPAMPGGAFVLQAPVPVPDAREEDARRGKTSLRGACGDIGLQLLLRLFREDFLATHPRLLLDASYASHEAALGMLVRKECQFALTTLGLRHKDRRKGLREYVLGRLALFAIVNPKNPCYDLRQDRLSDLLSGEQRSWDAVSNFPMPVDVLSCSIADPVQQRALGLLFPGRGLDKGARLYPTEGQVIAGVEHRMGALALVPSHLLPAGRKVKILSVAGVQPSAHTIRSGSYPLQFAIRLVVREDAELATLKLVSYLTGIRGQERISRIAYSGNR